MNALPFTIAADLDLGSRIGYLVTDAGRADVIIERGTVPVEMPGLGGSSGYAITPDCCLIAIPGGPRFLIEGGERITYQPAADNLDDVRLILLGTAFAALCYQRHWLPLHASAVMRDGVVHAFTTNSGGGKSTLAAALSRRDYAFFSDDIVLLPTTTDRNPMQCWSGQRDLKLWRDAFAMVSAEAGAPVADMTGRDKVFATPMRTSAAVSGELVTLTVLTDASKAEVSMLAGVDAVSAIMGAAYRPEICENVRGAAWLFRAAAKLAEVVTVQQFGRPLIADVFEDGVTVVENALTRPIQKEQSVGCKAA